MIQTIVIYSTLISVMLICTVPLYSKKRMSLMNGDNLNVLNHLSSFFIPVFLISMICGFRYGVGEDYFSYKEIYDSFNNLSTIEEQREEPLFLMLIYFLKKINAPYQLFFFLTSFIFFVCLYKSFENKNLRKLFPIAILFFFLTGGFFIAMSYIRQMIAFSIFLYAIRYISERNLKKYFLCITICFLFHKSAVILYPCFLFTYIKKEWIYKTFYIQVLLMVFSIFNGNSVVNYILNNITELITGTFYGGYVDVIKDWTIDIGRGRAIFFIALTDLFLVLINRSLLSFYVSSYYKIYYSVFFLGAFFEHLFYTNALLNRIPLYWVNTRFVIIAFLIFYILKEWKRCRSYIKFLGAFIFVLYMSYFFSMILTGSMNSSPFLLKI